VIDDDASVRRALGRLLRAAGYTVEEFASAGDFALRRTAQTGGCVILDIRMPGPDGLELQEALVRAGSGLQVIILTGYPEVSTSVKAMKAGAVDYLIKPVDKNALLAALRTAFSKSRSDSISEAARQALQQRHSALSPRERKVFELLVAGFLNKQVAAEIGVALRTVKAYRANIMEKMQASSFAELVHFSDALRDPAA